VRQLQAMVAGGCLLARGSWCSRAEVGTRIVLLRSLCVVVGPGSEVARGEVNGASGAGSGVVERFCGERRGWGVVVEVGRASLCGKELVVEARVRAARHYITLPTHASANGVLLAETAGTHSRSCPLRKRMKGLGLVYSLLYHSLLHMVTNPTNTAPSVENLY
jgi:hypothetical protein